MSIQFLQKNIYWVLCYAGNIDLLNLNVKLKQACCPPAIEVRGICYKKEKSAAEERRTPPMKRGVQYTAAEERGTLLLKRVVLC
jgi:hypothetical protein